jgi:hypothetical protein
VGPDIADPEYSDDDTIVVQSAQEHGWFDLLWSFFVSGIMTVRLI